MDVFLSRIKKLHNRIFNLKQYIDKLNVYHKRKLNDSLTIKDEKKLDNKIRAVEQIFKEKCKKIKFELKVIKKESLKDEEDDHFDAKEMQFLSLSKTFMDSLKLFWEVQVKYSREERLKISREYLIAKPEATKEEIDNFIQNKLEVRKSPFSISDQKSSALIDKINARKIKMREIANNAIEIVDLIKQMQFIVEGNKKIVDEIYVNINISKKQTDEANEDLDKALEAQRRSMWYKRLIYLVVFIVVCGLGIFAAFFIKRTFFNN